ncbi:hypothetical protein ACFW04_013401 [Cataglyphis niger]
MEKWDGYFRNLLGGGVEGKVVIGQRKGFRIDEEESRSEIRALIGRLKDNKAVGADGIPAEVWKYGGENVEEWKICNRGMIVSILKKGEGERVKEYKGVSLTSTLYKVYASVLAGRLSEEVEEKGLVPQNQTDLKAAFDSVDRRKLVEAMRERGLREELIRRSEDIMKETRNRVKRGEDLGTGFWTGREKEEGMRNMIGKLEGYLEKKGLELNERYLRWVFGVEWETPGYMVREELQREKLRMEKGWQKMLGEVKRVGERVVERIREIKTWGKE